MSLFFPGQMTGFLWQVVFWLKTAVIRRTLPPAARPGKRPAACMCVRGSEKAWAGALLVSPGRQHRTRTQPAAGGVALLPLGAEFAGNVLFWKVLG